MEQRILLETNWTEHYEQEPIFKYVLKAELNDDGTVFSILYNEIDDHGTGWGTKTFFDFEKALKFYLKRIAQLRKETIQKRTLKILVPNCAWGF
jgi:hypothetical protein